MFSNVFSYLIPQPFLPVLPITDTSSLFMVGQVGKTNFIFLPSGICIYLSGQNLAVKRFFIFRQGTSLSPDSRNWQGTILLRVVLFYMKFVRSQSDHKQNPSSLYVRYTTGSPFTETVCVFIKLFRQKGPFPKDSFFWKEQQNLHSAQVFFVIIQLITFTLPFLYIIL